MNYFLDTNTCIYFLKGQSESITQEMYSRSPSQIKIPSIVKSELLLGAYKSKNRKKNTGLIQSFLNPFEVIGFNDIEAEIYAEVRAELEIKGKIIGPNDLIIAAIVLAQNGTLITNNEKEFNRIKSLKIQNWFG